MFRATAPAVTVINKYGIFGQIINKVGKLPDFSHK